MNKKPIVLHVSTPKSWRGGEQQLFYLLGELEKEAITQFVLCPRGSVLSYKCEKAQFNYLSVSHRWSFDFLFAKNLAVFAKKINANIIHCHDSHALTAAYIAVTFMGCSASIVAARRVDFPISKSYFSLRKYNHLQVKKIICVSEAIKNIIAKDVLHTERLSVIYSGIDIQRIEEAKNIREEFIEKYNIPKDAIIIGNVAAHADHKDLFTFLDVAKNLNKQSKKLFFLQAGDGPLSTQIKEYSNKIGLTNIGFLGFYQYIPAFLKSIDVFLFTSKTEGLGTSIIDAMAAELPIVSTNAGGIPELLASTKSGLLSDVGDVKTLSQHCMSILNNQTLKAELKASAKNAAEKFNKKNTAKQTLTIYQELL